MKSKSVSLHICLILVGCFCSGCFGQIRSDIDAYWDLLLKPDGYGIDNEHFYYEDSRQYYHDTRK